MCTSWIKWYFLVLVDKTGYCLVQMIIFHHTCEILTADSCDLHFCLIDLTHKAEIQIFTFLYIDEVMIHV